MSHKKCLIKLLLHSFEEKINNLEEHLDYFSHKDIMYCQATQTEDVPSLKCEECDFEGGRDREIGWHVGRHHGDDKAEVMDMDDEGDRYCKECGYNAKSMYNLDAH